MGCLRFLLVVSLCCAFVGAINAEERGSYVAFKYSHINWDSNQFVLAGNTVVFEDNDPEGYAVELSMRMGHLFNIGVEYQYQSWGVRSDTGGDRGDFRTNKANIRLISAMARYKFTETGHIRPTLGIGFGEARFSLHSGTSVILEGWTYQINAAIEYKLTPGNALALSVGRTAIDVDDTYENKIKNYATIYQLSYNLHF